MEHILDRIRRLIVPGCLLAASGMILQLFSDPKSPLYDPQGQYAAFAPLGKYAMIAGNCVVLVAIGAQVGAWLAGRRA